MSALERALRLPLLISTVIKLFFVRTAPLWFSFSVIIWLLLHNIGAAIVIGFSFSLIWEMFALYRWYEKQVLPIHFKNISTIRESFKKMETFSISELISQIEESVKRSAWSIIHIVYLALPSWGWEIVFKALYPFLVSDKRIPYQYLLIGFSNKTVEADQELWKIAQEKNLTTQKKLLEQYLEIFGSRVEDIDLAYPTLRERPKSHRIPSRPIKINSIP